MRKSATVDRQSEIQIADIETAKTIICRLVREQEIN